MSTELAPFEKIAAEFRDLISSGALKPGDKLPTNRQIALDRHAARQTVTRAIGLLRDEGLVTTGGRGGTVVARQGRVESLAIALDGVSGLRVDSVEVTQASANAALELGVRPGSSVIVLQVRCAEDVNGPPE